EDVARQIAARFGRTLDITPIEDDEAARRAIEDGAADAALIPGRGQIIFHDDIDDEVLAIVQQAWAEAQVQEALAAAGLDDETISAALTTSPLEPVTLAGDDDTTDDVAFLTGTLAGILLFISLQTFGTYVLTGVVA